MIPPRIGGNSGKGSGFSRSSLCRACSRASPAPGHRQAGSCQRDRREFRQALRLVPGKRNGNGHGAPFDPQDSAGLHVNPRAALLRRLQLLAQGRHPRPMGVLRPDGAPEKNRRPAPNLLRARPHKDRRVAGARTSAAVVNHSPVNQMPLASGPLPRSLPFRCTARHSSLPPVQASQASIRSTRFQQALSWKLVQRFVA